MDQNGSSSVVIGVGEYLNALNSVAESEEESSVTIGLGGIIFAGIVSSSFFVYGTLCTYGMIVLYNRKLRSR